MPEIIDAGNIVTSNNSADYLLMERSGSLKRILKKDLLAWYDAKAYGLTGDGTTDDTAALQALINLVHTAGGGTIYFPEGIYLISGALQSTGTANAQIVIPDHPLSQPSITINFVGASCPPIQYFTFSNIVPTDGFSVIKSTLTGGTGTAACIAGDYTNYGSGLNNQNNTLLNVENIIFQAPPNPSFTMLNTLNMQANILRNVLFHCGSVNLSNMVQPTNTNAYAFKIPDYSHTPFNYLENVIVFGFYWGMRISENTIGNGLRFWSCYKCIDAAFGYHTSILLSVGIYWSPYGIVATGGDADQKCRLRVLLCDLEQYSTGWQALVYEVDDINNRIFGDITMQSVASGVGEVFNYPKNGGTNFKHRFVGATNYEWTTAGRPANPRAGVTGYNTTLNALETWNGSAWV